MVSRPRSVDSSTYWTPRVLAIALILFLLLFSFDVMELGLGFWGTLGAFLMHSLPSIVLALVLWLSWKREWIAAITFALAGVLYIGLMGWNLLGEQFEWYYLSWSFIIAGPAFLIAYLFYRSWKARKRY